MALGAISRLRWLKSFVCSGLLVLGSCASRAVIDDRAVVRELAEFSCVGDPRLRGDPAFRQYIDRDNWTVRHPSGFSVLVPGPGCLTLRNEAGRIEYLLAVMATGNTRGRNKWRGFEQDHVAVVLITDFRQVFGAVQPRDRTELRAFLEQDLGRLPRGPFASIYPSWGLPQRDRNGEPIATALPFRLLGVEVAESAADPRCVSAAVDSREHREGTGILGQMNGDPIPTLVIRQSFEALFCRGPHGNGAVIAFAQMHPVDDPGAAAREMEFRTRATGAFRSLRFE
jgi:hypothetical protein